MSNNKIIIVSKAYMLYPSINRKGILIERGEEPDRKYLARNATQLQLGLIAYIIQRRLRGFVHGSI